MYHDYYFIYLSSALLLSIYSFTFPIVGLHLALAVFTHLVRNFISRLNHVEDIEVSSKHTVSAPTVLVITSVLCNHVVCYSLCDQFRWPRYRCH